MSAKPVSGSRGGGAAGRRLRLALGLAITALFLWLLARGLDLQALGQAFAALSLPPLLAALGCMVAAMVLRIARWWLLLRSLEPGLPLAACVRPFLAGMAVNNVLPFRAGDALRVLGFRRQLRSPAMRVLGTVIIERVLDVLVVSGIFFLGVMGLPPGAMPPGFVAAAAWLAGAGVVAILACILFLPLWQRLQGRLPGRRFWAGRPWAAAAARHGANLSGALSLARSAPRLAALLAGSALIWACEGAAFMVVAAALQAGVAPLGPWLSLSAGALATSIPSAPGYIGTFDYFAAQGLMAYQAAPEVAAALALTVHALWIPLTVAGLLCLLPGAAPASAPARQDV